MEQSTKLKKARVSEDVCDEIDSKETIELYGKWQLEPLLLPRAVNGIVPKVIANCYISVIGFLGCLDM